MPGQPAWHEVVLPILQIILQLHPEMSRLAMTIQQRQTLIHTQSIVLLIMMRLGQFAINTSLYGDQMQSLPDFITGYGLDQDFIWNLDPDNLNLPAGTLGEVKFGK